MHVSVKHMHAELGHGFDVIGAFRGIDRAEKLLEPYREYQSVFLLDESAIIVVFFYFWWFETNLHIYLFILHFL